MNIGARIIGLFLGKEIKKNQKGHITKITVTTGDMTKVGMNAWVNC